MTDATYEKLRAVLDTFPIGFPKTESGVELEILKRLYTPEEASIAIHLRPKPEDSSKIAERMEGGPDALEEKLARMAGKGLAFRTEREGKAFYNAIPFMIGLYEYSVKKIDKDLAGLFRKYYDEAYQTEMGITDIPGFKVIPVQKHLQADITLFPYHRIEEDIRAARKIAVTDCVCRKESRLLGHGCDHPIETCLSFGVAAEYYINSGLGRSITADEAVRILKEADEAGLVHAGVNAKHLSNICNCCSCCCASMKGMVEKGQDKRKYMNALFEPVVDPALCTACEMCLSRCPVGALEVNEMAVPNLSKCLGCGLCASGCPSEAITMTLRADREEPYDYAHDLFRAMLKVKSARKM